MNEELTREFQKLQVDWEEIQTWRSPKKVVEYFHKVYSKWVAFCITLENESKAEYNRKLEDLKKDVKEHPDYQEMQKRLEQLEVMYKESERQKENVIKKNEELKHELRILRSQKKAGRPALDSWIVDRIVELRSKGLSIRKIQAQLEVEGIRISVPVVGKYVKETASD